MIVVRENITNWWVLGNKQLIHFVCIEKWPEMRIYMGSQARVNYLAGWLRALKCKDYKTRDIKVWGRDMVGVGRGFWSA